MKNSKTYRPPASTNAAAGGEYRRVLQIRKILRAAYPDVKTQLRHENPFQLLVATILSAQCTDRQVNAVTPGLFKRLKTPRDFADVPVAELERLIHSTGFFHNKAKNLKQCARALIAQFDGVVPDTRDDLVKLPGVGRKTANVVLGAAFGKPGIVVDTHVARISGRLGLTAHKDPVRIEFDLMERIPKKDWNDFSLWLIYLGRSLCMARKPDCPACFLRHLCPYPEKTGGPVDGPVRL
ncbi:MAG: endonuclease III [Desulfobacteraceae bacterium]|nr:MAG: endonuclease III [Desulfobacteraceae bacterium]